MNSLAVTLCLLVLSSAVSAQYYGEDELASTVDRTWVLFAATLVFCKTDLLFYNSLF